MALFPSSFWHFIDMNVLAQHCPETKKHCFQFTEAELQNTVSTLANITHPFTYGRTRRFQLNTELLLELGEIKRDLLEGRKALQLDLGGLDQWAAYNCKAFNRCNMQVHLGVRILAWDMGNQITTFCPTSDIFFHLSKATVHPAFQSPSFKRRIALFWLRKVCSNYNKNQ